MRRFESHANTSDSSSSSDSDSSTSNSTDPSDTLPRIPTLRSNSRPISSTTIAVRIDPAIRRDRGRPSLSVSGPRWGIIFGGNFLQNIW